jgi:hypothetical protein
MSIIYSENVAHRAALLAAEQALQAAAVPGASAATLKAAAIAFHRAALSSALANNCGITTFTTALRELGTGGT